MATPEEMDQAAKEALDDLIKMCDPAAAKQIASGTGA